MINFIAISYIHIKAFPRNVNNDRNLKHARDNVSEVYLRFIYTTQHNALRPKLASPILVGIAWKRRGVYSPTPVNYSSFVPDLLGRRPRYPG